MQYQPKYCRKHCKTDRSQLSLSTTARTKTDSTHSLLGLSADSVPCMPVAELCVHMVAHSLLPILQENVNANLSAQAFSFPDASLLSGSNAARLDQRQSAQASQPASSSTFANSLAMLQDLAHGRTAKSSRRNPLSPQDQLPTSFQLPHAPLLRFRPAASYAPDCTKLSQPAPLSSMSLLSSVSQGGNAPQHYLQPSNFSQRPSAARQGLHHEAQGAKARSQASHAEVRVSVQLPASSIRPVSRSTAENAPAAALTPDTGTFAAQFLSSTALVDKPPQLDSLCKAHFGLESSHEPSGVSSAYAAHAADPDDASVPSHGTKLHQGTTGRALAADSLADNTVEFPMRQSDFSRYGLTAQLLELVFTDMSGGESPHTLHAGQ